VAKANSGEVEVKGKWGVIKVGAGTLAGVLLALGGMFGLNARAEKPAAEYSLSADPAFATLKQEIKGHCDQQEKDQRRQEAYDHGQDEAVKMMNDGIQSLQNGQVGTNERLKALEGQVLEMRNDIKALLRHRQSGEP